MSSDYIVFDTETTGLVKNRSVRLENQPRVIEYAAIRVNPKGKEIDRLEFLCDPGIPISEEITKITGIKPAAVKGKPPFKAHVKDLVKLHMNIKGVVAHNLSFDMAIIDFAMRMAEVKTWGWPPRKICTVESTVHIKGRRMSLSELHESLFNDGFDGAHRAMNDVEALKRCLLQLAATGVIAL